MASSRVLDALGSDAQYLLRTRHQSFGTIVLRPTATQKNFGFASLRVQGDQILLV